MTRLAHIALGRARVMGLCLAIALPAFGQAQLAADERYEHPVMKFSLVPGERWAVFDYRHAEALDSAIETQSPAKGSKVYEKRWKAGIYAGEREAVVAGRQGVYLLPRGDWVPPGSEMRILITTRTGQCPTMEDFENPDFEGRMKGMLERHHLKEGTGQRQLSWERMLTSYLDADNPMGPDGKPVLATAIFRGQVLRENGQRLAIYYQLLPGGDRFFRIKAVCRAEALPLLKPELERLVASFGGFRPGRSVLWAEFLRFLPIGVGLLIVLLLLQQRRIRRDDQQLREERRAARAESENA